MFEILREEAAARGLTLSTVRTAQERGQSKCCVWCPGGSVVGSSDPLRNRILPIEEEGLVQLGCPIGPERNVAIKIRDKN